MTLTLDIPLSTQNAEQADKLVKAAVSLFDARIVSLEQAAQIAGLSPSELLEEVGHAEADAKNVTSEPLRQERGKEEAERFRQWADSHRRDLPVIPLDSMSREQMYEDRG